MTSGSRSLNRKSRRSRRKGTAMTNLDTVKTALLTVAQKCYHYSAPQSITGPYIVWAEDNQADSVWADGRMQEQSIEGTVDYFTKTENIPMYRASENTEYCGRFFKQFV